MSLVIVVFLVAAALVYILNLTEPEPQGSSDSAPVPPAPTPISALPTRASSNDADSRHSLDSSASSLSHPGPRADPSAAGKKLFGLVLGKGKLFGRKHKDKDKEIEPQPPKAASRQKRSQAKAFLTPPPPSLESPTTDSSLDPLDTAPITPPPGALHPDLDPAVLSAADHRAALGAYAAQLMAYQRERKRADKSHRAAVWFADAERKKNETLQAAQTERDHRAAVEAQQRAEEAAARERVRAPHGTRMETTRVLPPPPGTRVGLPKRVPAEGARNCEREGEGSRDADRDRERYQPKSHPDQQRHHQTSIPRPRQWPHSKPALPPRPVLAARPTARRAESAPVVSYEPVPRTASVLTPAPAPEPAPTPTLTAAWQPHVPRPKNAYSHTSALPATYSPASVNGSSMLNSRPLPTTPEESYAHPHYGAHPRHHLSGSSNRRTYAHGDAHAQAYRTSATRPPPPTVPSGGDKHNPALAPAAAAASAPTTPYPRADPFAIAVHYVHEYERRADAPPAARRHK